MCSHFSDRKQVVMKSICDITAILRTSLGDEITFPQPDARDDVRLFWRFEEQEESIFACFADGYCRGGFNGEAAIIFRPAFSSEDVSFMGIENHCEYWCIPRFGHRFDEIPDNVRLQSLLIKDNGTYRYYLPVCDSMYKTYISGGGGSFELRMLTNCSGIEECSDQLSFVCGEGDDPYALMRKCARFAAKLLGNGLHMREEREYPEVFEYLGWCSWDALQIRVSHKGLIEKATELKEKKVPVRYAIIDDMWADCPNLNTIPDGISFGRMVQQMHGTRMHSFAGDPKRFPHGMQAAIEALKDAGMRYVGIWFPTTGYWFGWDEEGEAAEMRDLLDYSCAGRLIVKPDKAEAEAYFARLCGKARSWGADFVKIDNQAFHRTNYKDKAAIGSSARAVNSAIDSAVENSFGGAVINCMGMASECMFNRPTSAVCRCSDDFIPEDRAWFAKNILECAYNGTLQGQYYVNDWDMWWTRDDQAIKNSLCRAISGGPIYISDKIGMTAPEVLLPLFLSDGRILRADESAVPSADCLTEDPTSSGRIFKIRNRVGKNGVVAVFNVDSENRAVNGIISASDSGLDETDYAYYDYFSGTHGILRRGERLEISLADNDEVRLFTLVPYSAGGISVIGRIDKFIGVKAVTDIDNSRFSLLEGGEIAVIAERELKFWTADRELEYIKDGNKYVFKCNENETEIFYSFA